MRRVIVITGGTAGVGRAIARRFACERDAVAVLARGQEGLAATVRDIKRLGGHGLGIAGDVADAGQVEAAAEQVERELGPIDVWINNAMTTAVGPVEAITPEEFQRITDVCYHGCVWGTRAALRHMRPRNRGTILQVGSALAYRSIPLQAAYCGAKHAIRGFTDSLRSELLHERVNIALCMVQLPAINTPQFDWCVNKMDHALGPVPPIFQPEIVADAIHRLSRYPRREVLLGGSAIKAILGNKLVPGLADRYLASRGYTGQLRDAPNLHGPANLFAPVPGDHGAHGRFDHQARSRDVVARIATVLGGAGVQAVVAAAVATAGAALVAATSAWWTARRSS
ncbi:MAG TPA: SDR family oxidoreductase [Kofleriaceae bacterium]|jgi:NAD(P)-dependent dehydrogenase (short-subunit alcohol dehydrogenase family)|nr:SDR family oxidoreductase [Kofleriaceae bacterium]